MSDTKDDLNCSMCIGGEVVSRTMSLHKLSPTKLMLRRSFVQYILYIGLVVVALSFFDVGDITKFRERSIWHSILIIIAIGSPLIIGLIGLTVGFRTRKIMISKDLTSIEIIPGLTGKRKIIQFDEIKSLQLLYHRFGEDESCHCYEINLVFSEMKKDRYNLACYDDPKTAKIIIEQLSEFMNKPYFFAGLYDWRLGKN